MRLTKKILLSYSIEDDLALDGGSKGWVTNFLKFLSTLLDQISKVKIEIETRYGDDLLDVNFTEYTAILVVTTSNFIENEGFIQKLNNHIIDLKNRDSLRSNNVARVFKINKMPHEANYFIAEIANLISYDFFIVDRLTGNPVIFKSFFGQEAERSFWMKLVDMAYDINQLVIFDTQHEDTAQIEDEGVARDKTVYLASTGVDMVIQRDIIKRELIRHGYRVLPSHSLPKESVSLEAMIKEDLYKCRLSIHLIGEDYGYRPKGSDLSVIDIQNRLASNHTYAMVDYNKTAAVKKPFSRLIWVSPDLKNITERQKIFIEDLKSDAAALEEAEVLQIPLPELKTIIREELVTGGRFNVVQRTINGFESQDEEKQSSIVYLIVDRQDKRAITDYQRYLEDKGIKVVTPSFDGDLVDIRYVHQENLRRCDAAIIYFGNATEAWIKTKLQDLMKAPGFGREKKFLAKAVLAKPNQDLDFLKSGIKQTLLLEQSDYFEPKDLDLFLSQLEKGYEPKSI